MAEETAKSTDAIDGRSRRRWRNYLFVDPKIQLNFAAALSVAGGFTSAFFLFAVYFYFQDAFLRISEADPAYVPVEHLLRVNHDFFVQTLSAIAVVYCGLLFVLGLLFSHRIAGPLINVARTLRAVSRGYIPEPVQLRRSDLLAVLGTHINEMLAGLHEQRAEMRNAIESAVVALEEASPEEVEKARETLEGALQSNALCSIADVKTEESP